MITRRGIITGLISFAAAPAIVRASSLMPIKVYDELVFKEFYRGREWEVYRSEFNWNPGKLIQDWRYVARIANIDAQPR